MSGIIFMVTVAAVVIFVVNQRHKERMMLIEKGLYNKRETTKPPLNMHTGSLLFGLVFTGIGIALLIGTIIHYPDAGDIGIGGLVTLFIGLAMLLFWKLKAADRKAAREWYETNCLPYDTTKTPADNTETF